MKIKSGKEKVELLTLEDNKSYKVVHTIKRKVIDSQTYNDYYTALWAFIDHEKRLTAKIKHKQAINIALSLALAVVMLAIVLSDIMCNK